VTPFSASVPADPKCLAALRRDMRHWLAATGMDELARGELLVALGEACANAIEHAYAFSPDRHMEVTATADEHEVRVEVRDAGRWKMPGPKRHDRGRGLAMMAALTDAVEVERMQTGTTVRLTRKLA
jgi:anti-sigma regulatory factor (Ser/Thr protein kinase)